MLFLFAFLSLLVQVYNYQLVCAGNKVVNPNIKGFAFPSGWSDDEPALQVQPGQDCVWTVTVPVGQYAKVTALGKIGSGKKNIVAIDAVGNIDASNEENLIPYFFPAPRFNLRLQAAADSNDTFAFQITWTRLPVGAVSNDITNETVLVNTNSWFEIPQVYNAVTQVSLVVIPMNPDNYRTLRSTFVYDGPSMNSNYIGTFLPVAQSKKQLVSSGQSFLIVNLHSTFGSQDLIVAQDYANTKDYGVYVGLECYDNGTCINSAQASANTKTVYLSASNALDTIEQITMDKDATLSIYHDVIKPTDLWSTFSSTEIQSHLPTAFTGFIKQYVFSGYDSSIRITRKYQSG